MPAYLVFEPGGSGLEWRVLQVAERMRRAARRPAEVLPGFPVGPTAPDTSQPSAFARPPSRWRCGQTRSRLCPSRRPADQRSAGAKMVVLRALRTMLMVPDSMTSPRIFSSPLAMIQTDFSSGFEPTVNSPPASSGSILMVPWKG